MFISCLLFSLLLLWVSTDGSSALQITSPSEGFVWNEKEPLVIQWSTFQNDPTRFGIQITNNDPNTYPAPMNRIIAKSVSATAGSYTIKHKLGLRVGGGYQINLISKNSGLVAQSSWFSISADSGRFDGTASSGSGYNSPYASDANSTPVDSYGGNNNKNSYGPNSSARTSVAHRLSVFPFQMAAGWFSIVYFVYCI